MNAIPTTATTTTVSARGVLQSAAQLLTNSLIQSVSLFQRIE